MDNNKNTRKWMGRKESAARVERREDANIRISRNGHQSVIAYCLVRSASRDCSMSFGTGTLWLRSSGDIKQEPHKKLPPVLT